MTLIVPNKSDGIHEMKKEGESIGHERMYNPCILRYANSGMELNIPTTTLPLYLHFYH